MPDPAPSPTIETAPDSSASGAVLQSHPRCISCQYDLHGQSTNGQCPECGWNVATTLRALDLNHAWLLTIRSGLRWLLASMYMLAFLVVTRYFSTMDYALVALMQLAAAVSLITPNPNRPGDRETHRWPPRVIAAAIALHLISAGNWDTGSVLSWTLEALGASLQAIGVALLWWRIQAVFDQGVAPKSAVIARNLAGLTMILGVFLLLPPVVYHFTSGSAWSAAVASAVELLFLLTLVVWFFGSIITLHLTGPALARLITTTESA